jgi:hypothetical protein
MLAPMTRDDIENSILETVAEATIAGTPASRAVLTSRGVEADPVLEFLLDRAVTAFMQDTRARDRLELKLLKLDPEHFEKLKQEQAAIAAKPRSKAAIRRDAVAKEKHDDAQKRFVQYATKMAAALAFYDSWKLADGTTLGDATKAKLTVEAAQSKARGIGHIRNAQFYTSLAKKLTGDQTVGEVIPLTDAHRLREKFFGEVGR